MDGQLFFVCPVIGKDLSNRLLHISKTGTWDDEDDQAVQTTITRFLLESFEVIQSYTLEKLSSLGLFDDASKSGQPHNLVDFDDGIPGSYYHIRIDLVIMSNDELEYYIKKGKTKTKRKPSKKTNEVKTPTKNAG